MYVFVILQSEENEKPDPFPSFRGRSLSSYSDCSAGITGADDKMQTEVVFSSQLYVIEFPF